MLPNIDMYIKECAPTVAPSTMKAIVATESKGNPLSIGINNKYKLKYQPHTLVQARSWLDYLVKHGYNVDVGLAQVNIKNIRKYGYQPTDMLDPCKNLLVASKILYTNYHQAYSTNSGNKSLALLQAISAYNTGNYQSGFNNGYVQRVLGQAVLVNKNLINSSTESSSKRGSVLYAKARDEISRQSSYGK